MRVNVDIQLKDIPGQLIGALEPISKNDGNIRSVVHRHDKISGGKIAINLTFEVGNQKALDNILGDWKGRDVDVLRTSTTCSRRSGSTTSSSESCRRRRSGRS